MIDWRGLCHLVLRPDGVRLVPPPRRPRVDGTLLEAWASHKIANMELSEATGYAERETALTLLRRLPKSARRRTVGGDKGFDTRDFVAGCGRSGCPPTWPRTPAIAAAPSTDGPPDMPATSPVSASASRSGNPSGG
jgi:hypothetical protein